MLYAVLCALCWSLSTVYAARSARAVGVERATLVRIVLAALVLGVWALARGPVLPAGAVGWLLLGGLVGMGLGDIAAFQALGLIGARLTALLDQCLTAPIALVLEIAWLRVWPRPAQAACMALILAGIALAMARDEPTETPRAAPPGGFGLGVALALFGAFCTAAGAVMSRRALACLPAGTHWDPGVAAFYRMAAGAAITAFWYRRLLRHWACRRPSASEPCWRGSVQRYRWTIANALLGSVLGMAAMQQALATLPAGLVVAVTSTSPLLVVGWLWWLEGVRPTPRALAGGALAVAGVAALQWA